MSKLNVNSVVYCSCSKRTDFGDVIRDVRRYHDINGVSFCPSCQTLRCKFCTKSEIVMKYCCSCMSDYSSTTEVHCTKNCFVCPQCDALLAISLSDHRVEGVLGKKFSFTCTFCDYRYQTKIITKPKSILNILRGEYTENNELVEYFEHISTIHKHRLNYETLEDQMIKDLKSGIKYKGISIEAMRHINEMKLKIPQDEGLETLDSVKLILEDNKPVVLSETLEEPMQKRFPTTDGFMMFNGMNSNIQESAALLPVPKRLSSKYTNKCCDCNHTLLMPTDEVLSTKYHTMWNANDYLPLISVSPLLNQDMPKLMESGKLYTFLINIVNPLLVPMTINLSSPSEFDENKSKIQTTIPISTVSIGEFNPKDHLIRGIPTPFLTKETKISRAERVMRLGKLSSMRNNDTSIEFMETLVQKNDNWCLLPLEITLTSDIEAATLQIPVFVNVQSRLPDTIKLLKLTKKELSYGFWSILNLGKINISH